MRPGPVAIVPIKPAPGAKARLASVLARDDRAALARALFEHVAGVTLSAGLRTIALAAGPVIVPAGADLWREEAGGLNRALRAALARVEGDVLVLPSDLPWLTTRDIGALIREPGDVVVAPAADGGTSALLLRVRIEPGFGADSALRHLHNAHRAGLQGQLVRSPGLEHDLDDEPALRLALATSPALVPPLRGRLLRALSGSSPWTPSRPGSASR